MNRFFRHQTSVAFSFITITILLCVSPISTVLSQEIRDTTRFEKGLELYDRAQFKEAAEVFSQISTPKSVLFTAKSYFGSGQYLKSQQQLDKIKKDAPTSIYLESLYTKALTAFQLNQHKRSAQLLHSLTTRDELDQELRQKAQNFYTDLISYLTIKQRKELFMSTTAPGIRLDILESLIGRMNYSTLVSLNKEFRDYLPDSSQATLQYERLKTALKDSLRYKSKYTSGPYSESVPDGISYNIGVALPLFNTQKPEFEVTRGLYNGILLAAEEYNRQHSDTKVFIRYPSTTDQSSSASAVFNQLIWKQPIDAFIGPLFSESAFRMASLAEQFEVPILTPLANSDTLNLDNPYMFQVNPTFSVRGRKMARYAVKKLGLDTMAVIAQEGTSGSESAFAFRDKAERLGAKVAYFFVEDFSAKAYDLSDYTKYLTADKKMRDSLNIQKIDAIYAPFTGKASNTLINLLMTDLEAANSKTVLLGSAEWKSLDIGEQTSSFDIYYPETDPLSADSSQYSQFDQAYKTRFDLSPSKFSYIGYDTAQFLLETLEVVGNPAYLKRALKEKKLFKGLTGPIDFRGQHINQEIEIRKLQSAGQ